MNDKIARLGIERDTDLMYYIKPDGNVWATPRKKPGQPKGKAQKIADTGLDLDYSRYIYFLDKEGDVARKERKTGGGGKRAKTSPATPKAKAPKAVKTSGRGKSKAQLDADIEECVAKARGAHARKRR
jgi:hypothetical protein